MTNDQNPNNTNTTSRFKPKYLRLYIFILAVIFVLEADNSNANEIVIEALADNTVPTRSDRHKGYEDKNEIPTRLLSATYEGDTCKDVTLKNALSNGGVYIPSFANKFSYGIPWKGVVYETVEDKGIVLQNSIPKCSGYTDADGRQFGFCVYWTRVMNETTSPLDLTISFPPFLYTGFPSLESFFKVFLPTDTMTLDNMLLFDYGATGAKDFFENNRHHPTMLQKTIAPNEEYQFYVAVACSQDYSAGSRAGLVIKDQELFYRIERISPELDSILIHCGKLIESKVRR